MPVHIDATACVVMSQVPPALSPGGFGEQGDCLVCFVGAYRPSWCPSTPLGNAFNPNLTSPGRKGREVLQLLMLSPRVKNR